MFVVLVVAIAIAVVVVAVARQPDPVKRAAALSRAGLGLMAVSTFFGAFLIGDTFPSPCPAWAASWGLPHSRLSAQPRLSPESSTWPPLTQWDGAPPASMGTGPAEQPKAV